MPCSSCGMKCVHACTAAAVAYLPTIPNIPAIHTITLYTYWRNTDHYQEGLPGRWSVPIVSQRPFFHISRTMVWGWNEKYELTRGRWRFSRLFLWLRMWLSLLSSAMLTTLHRSLSLSPTRSRRWSESELSNNKSQDNIDNTNRAGVLFSFPPTRYHEVMSHTHTHTFFNLLFLGMAGCYGTAGSSYHHMSTIRCIFPIPKSKAMEQLSFPWNWFVSHLTTTVQPPGTTSGTVPHFHQYGQ